MDTTKAEKETQTYEGNDESREMFYCKRNKQGIPVKTIYIKELEDNLYARSMVSCNFKDCLNKKAGKFLAKFYLEKELTKKELEDKADKVIEKLYDWTYDAGNSKRVLKIKENIAQEKQELNSLIKDLVEQYNGFFYGDMMELAQEMGVCNNKSVRDVLKNESSLRIERPERREEKRDKHVKLSLSQENLDQYEKKVFERMKKETEEGLSDLSDGKIC